MQCHSPTWTAAIWLNQPLSYRCQNSEAGRMSWWTEVLVQRWLWAGLFLTLDTSQISRFRGDCRHGWWYLGYDYCIYTHAHNHLLSTLIRIVKGEDCREENWSEHQLIVRERHWPWKDTLILKKRCTLQANFVTYCCFSLRLEIEGREKGKFLSHSQRL